MAKFLKNHQDFDHCSFRKLRIIAQQGIIAPIFKNAIIPVYSAYVNSKATRQAWRNKMAKNYKVDLTRSPRDCVSVNQLFLPTLGLIVQLTGKLTA